MKKRIFYAVLIIMYIITSTVYAEISVQIYENQHAPEGTEFRVETREGFAEVFNINGLNYLYNKWDNYETNPTPYDETLSSIMFDDYIITDEYYLVRDCSEGRAIVAYFPNNTLDIYDKNMNLLHSEDFGGGVYVVDMGYADGVFYAKYREKYEITKDDNGNEIYARLYGPDKATRWQKERFVTVKSTDMITWAETDEEIPRSNSVSNVKYGMTTVTDGTMKNVNYESGQNGYFYETKLGDIFLFSERENEDSTGKIKSFCLTNDNVYFIKVDAPLEFAETYDSIEAYEYEDEIIISTPQHGNYCAMSSAEEIYEQLAKRENAPYVVMNNNVLGFETPPVIEDDHTLVPMRFLFEQMGADVEWNQETQTATATMNNTAVAFSINDTNAEVNGAAATMDVPARLINDKTMVPLRFLSEEMGYTVTWDESTRTAVIE